MCGIIALLRGPGARLDLPPSAVLDRLTAVQDSLDDVDPIAAADRAAELLEELDGLLRSPDGVALLVRNREVAARTEAVTAVAGDWAASVEGGPRRPRCSRGPLARVGQRLTAPAQGRAVGRGSRPPPDGDGRARARRREPVVVGHRGRHLDPAGAVRARPSRGARTGFGGAHRARPGPRPRSRRSRGGAPGRGAQRRPPVPLERRPHPGGPPQLRLQGGRGDRRAR